MEEERTQTPAETLPAAPSSPRPRRATGRKRRSRLYRAFVAVAAVAAILGGLVGGGLTYSLQRGPRAFASPAETGSGLGAGPGGAAVRGDVASSEENTVQVVQAAIPGVVQIRTAGERKVRVERSPFRDFFGPGFPFNTPGFDGGDTPEQSVPTGAIGSGFVYDRDGHVITNNHVVEGAKSVQVVLSTGKTYAAKVVDTDRLSDLAVLKIDAPASELYPLPLADSDAVKVGQKAIAIGSPLGGDGEFGLDRSATVTQGIISAKDRTMPVPEGKSGIRFNIEGLLQTDAAINPGNSGGPLLNSRGEVMGVNTAIIPSAQGIGFAVSSNTVRRVVPQLIAGKKVQRPWIGVEFQGLDNLKRELGGEFAKLGLSTDSGALIVRVSADSPADRAGLRGGGRKVEVPGGEIIVGGDIITAINGAAITGANLPAEVMKYAPGDTVKVTYLRDGKTMTTGVKLASRE